MTKQEFLNELKESLSGEVSPEAMMDSYRYYDSYIDDHIRMGQTEEEVIEELGKPALIARSIIAAQTGERAVDEEYTEDGKTKRVRRKESRESYEEERYYNEKTGAEHKEFHFDFSAWYAKLLYVLIVVLLLILVFCILKGILWIFFTFGIPILIVLGIIYLIMYFTGNK